MSGSRIPWFPQWLQILHLTYSKYDLQTSSRHNLMLCVFHNSLVSKFEAKNCISVHFPLWIYKWTYSSTILKSIEKYSPIWLLENTQASSQNTQFPEPVWYAPHRSNQCNCNQSCYSGKDNRLTAWLTRTVRSPQTVWQLLKRKKKYVHNMTKKSP